MLSISLTIHGKHGNNAAAALNSFVCEVLGYAKTIEEANVVALCSMAIPDQNKCVIAATCNIEVPGTVNDVFASGKFDTLAAADTVIDKPNYGFYDVSIVNREYRSEPISTPMQKYLGDDPYVNIVMLSNDSADIPGILPGYDTIELTVNGDPATMPKYARAFKYRGVTRNTDGTVIDNTDFFKFDF